MSLYVGNLHPGCAEDILFKKFSAAGEVSSVKVCRDSATSTSLGYGYVNFSKEEDAKKALDAMNYDMLCGRVIRIMWAQRSPNNLPKSANLVVKNLHSLTKEVDLKNVFSPFGEILSIKVAKNLRGDSKGYGFIQFSDDEAADRALSSLTDAEIHGRKLLIAKFFSAEERERFQQTTFPNNIYVCNLSYTTDEELCKICGAFGDVVSAKVIASDEGNRCRGFAFVSFQNVKSAERAVRGLNKLYLNGKRLAANFCRKKSILETL